MKNFQKVSLVSLIGGSLFIADNVFGVDGNNVRALTQETSDLLRAKRIAATLAPTIGLLLLDNKELAVDDSYIAQRNTLFTINAASGVLSNDDTQNNPILTLLQNVNNGALTLNPDGSFEYLPNIDFTGIDSFTYRLVASNRETDGAMVNIRVNGKPEAFDDNYILASNTQLQDNVIINVIGGSDTILDGAQVVEVIDEVTTLGGTISIQANGDFEYTPPVDLGTQPDSFVYTLQDNDGEMDTATITWQIGLSFVGLDHPFSVEENQTLNTQFTITASNGLQTLELNSTSFNLAQLNAATVSAPLLISGEQFGKFSITGFDEASGVLNFNYDPTGIAQDHSTVISDALSESIAIRATDSSIVTPFDAQLLIEVLDTSPVANNDARDIFEGDSPIEGNAFDIFGSAAGDVRDIVIDPATVTDLDSSVTDGAVDIDVAGDFGAMEINSTGVYTYTLDNSSTEVQGLKGGESLTDVFTYTLTDNEAPKADSDTATITVTINGVEDARPTISIADLNSGAAGQQSVTEGAGDSVNGTATINATAGIQSLTLSGQEVSNASSTAVTIIGADGNLEATGFDAGTGILSYTYTEDAMGDDHSAGAVTDQFTIVATDNEDDTGTDTLSITIDDTQPAAVADSNTMAEDAPSTVISGDLLFNDTLGADTPLTINGIDAGSSDQTLGQYGTLLIASDGPYTYMLNNGDAAVQALRSNQQLTDPFSYSLTDADGDSSNSLLIISITGLDEPPALTIPDNNGTIAAGDESVAENSTLNNRLFSVNVESGLATIGTALQVTNEQGSSLNLSLLQVQDLSFSTQTLVGIDGTLTLNDFSISGDDLTMSYSFDPTNTNRDHSAGDQSVVEMFSILAIDDLGRSSDSGVLDILITDTAPTAASDTANITEDAVSGVVAGDVTTNDTQGADTAISVVGVDFEGAQTVGTPFSSDYGTLDLNADGTYTYTLDNGNIALDDLDTGESLSETFSYTIVDTDGDTSSTTLTVTINGADEPPSMTAADVNAAGDIGSVTEDAMPDLITGNVFDKNTAANNRSKTQLQFSGGSKTIDALMAATYGDLVLNDDGSFTYTLDNIDRYTEASITDIEVDSSISTLSTTINRVDG